MNDVFQLDGDAIFHLVLFDYLLLNVAQVLVDFDFDQLRYTAVVVALKACTKSTSATARHKNGGHVVRWWEDFF